MIAQHGKGSLVVEVERDAAHAAVGLVQGRVVVPHLERACFAEVPVTKWDDTKIPPLKTTRRKRRSCGARLRASHTTAPVTVPFVSRRVSRVSLGRDMESAVARSDPVERRKARGPVPQLARFRYHFFFLLFLTRARARARARARVKKRP